MRNGLVTLVLIVGTAALLYLFLFNDEPSQTIPYSGSEDAFLTAVAEGTVDSVLMRGEKLEITLKEKDDQGANRRRRVLRAQPVHDFACATTWCRPVRPAPAATRYPH